MRRGNRQSRHSSTFTWFYEMNADATLKPITKQILGVMAIKKHQEVEIDGEHVVRVQASRAEIAEWTGHHTVTISHELKGARQAGWLEACVRGNGAGKKGVYLLTYPEKGSDVTTKRVATSLQEGQSRDYRKGSQNFANQQVEASQNAQVPEVLEGTEGTCRASRTRVTRAPRATQKKNEKPAGLAHRDKAAAIRDCRLCDDRGGIGLRAGPFITCPHDVEEIARLERYHEMQESEGA